MTGTVLRAMCGAVSAATLAMAGAAVAAPAILAAPVAPGPDVRPYVKVAEPVVALRHVTLIDGRGGPAQLDMTIVLRDGRIAAVGADVAIPAGAAVFDLSGRSVIPGLVGMHNHMFYIARPNQDGANHTEPPMMGPQMTFSAPRLYLAGGVTTMRTAGSVEPYTDLNVKALIDQGGIPGPHMDVTGPYLEGPGGAFIQHHALRDVEDARRTVAFWADQGVTSFKAYMYITHDELKAAIEEAHRRGLKVTGHLCTVTYVEAADLGIDNIEHGFLHNTEFDPGKTPGVCTSSVGKDTLAAMDPGGPAARALIQHLISHHVALTSTLPVSEQNQPWRVPLNPRAMAVLTPEAREAYLYQRNRLATQPREQATNDVRSFDHNMAMQREFVAAGGLLMAGPDPTGNGGVIPGFGDQRGVELLVESGFKPEEAVRIASYNGAVYLGLADQIGSVEAGKRADLVVVKGDAAHDISAIENVEIVFKDGVGYDPARLLESVRGRYGQY